VTIINYFRLVLHDSLIRSLRMNIRISLFLLLTLYSCSDQKIDQVDWDHYLGDADKSQYSNLEQINTSNVGQLEIAWSYSSGDVDTSNRSQIQCNPLIIDGIMYATSPKLKLMAIDAKSGEHVWIFDPFDGNYELYGMGVNRGLAWHEDEDGARLLFTASDQLYAINPSDGLIIDKFGNQGKVDLHEGLGEEAKDFFVTSNSPGIVYKNLLIMGTRVSESTGAAPGHIRAFNVHTGDLEWIFHTIPRPGEMGHDTWPKEAYRNNGGANVWAGFSLDEERGIVYCPTGSASYDFYGGDRKGDNLFANCILALDAATGKRIWHYQTIHHDMWDKDLPVAPNLVTILKDGKKVDALVQATKNGFLYVLDRSTGEPLYPIDEVEVPQSDLIGEHSSPTQPWPSVYPAFSRQSFTKEDLADRNAEAASYANFIYETTHHDNLYEPPSEEGTIIFPGLDGGGEWGGAAYDPIERDLIINSNEVLWLCNMDKNEPLAKGEGLYKSFCQSCHGEQFKGNQLFGNVPSLVNLKNRVDLKDAIQIVNNGRGAMPGISWMTEDEVKAIYAYINEEEDSSDKVVDDSWPYPYRMRGYVKLYAADGFPIIKPPWGQLTSIDLDNAKINWQVPLGTYEELEDQGLYNTGTENYGGPVATSGGLVFIASTSDEKIRAYDKSNGTVLWEHDLPAAGYATPAVYAIDDQQYIVVGCGGGKLGTKSGDRYVAFALPDKL